MRVRPSDELTNPEFKIGVCRQCGRYGQLDRTRLVCALPEPKGLVPDEFYRRVRYCQRVGVKRGFAD